MGHVANRSGSGASSSLTVSDRVVEGKGIAKDLPGPVYRGPGAEGWKIIS